MYVIIEVRNQGTGFQQEIFKDKVYAKMELTVLVKSTGYEEKISQKNRTEQFFNFTFYEIYLFEKA